MIKNFRDISKFNKKIKKGIIFRSSALCLVENKIELDKMLKKHNISTIIDLRAKREIKICDYTREQKENYKIVNAFFDPWNQSIEFQKTYNKGTDIEIAYQFFSLECKSSIKKVVEVILNAKNAVNIHCHAGKDRTGIVITIFQLLSGANEDVIFLDYMASEMDTKKEYLQIFLDIVKEHGGISKYLKSCGLTQQNILQLKNKICL